MQQQQQQQQCYRDYVLCDLLVFFSHDSELVLVPVSSFIQHVETWTESNQHHINSIQICFFLIPSYFQCLCQRGHQTMRRSFLRHSYLEVEGLSLVPLASIVLAAKKHKKKFKYCFMWLPRCVCGGMWVESYIKKCFSERQLSRHP